MSEETTPANTVLIELTVEIVRAYVSKNSMRAAGLPDLIARARRGRVAGRADR